MGDVFAAFVVVPYRGGYAAVRRKDGSIGLPGGKLEPGETAEDALRREAREEGWSLRGGLRHLVTGVVDGRRVAWYAAADVRRVRPGEGDNARPIVASLRQILRNRRFQAPLRRYVMRPGIHGGRFRIVHGRVRYLPSGLRKASEVIEDAGSLAREHRRVVRRLKKAIRAMRSKRPDDDRPAVRQLAKETAIQEGELRRYERAEGLTKARPYTRIDSRTGKLEYVRGYQGRPRRPEPQSAAMSGGPAPDASSTEERRIADEPRSKKKSSKADSRRLASADLDSGVLPDGFYESDLHQGGLLKRAARAKKGKAWRVMTAGSTKINETFATEHEASNRIRELAGRVNPQPDSSSTVVWHFPDGMMIKKLSAGRSGEAHEWHHARTMDEAHAKMEEYRRIISSLTEVPSRSFKTKDDDKVEMLMHKSLPQARWIRHKGKLQYYPREEEARAAYQDLYRKHALFGAPDIPAWSTRSFIDAGRDILKSIPSGSEILDYLDNRRSEEHDFDHVRLYNDLAKRLRSPRITDEYIASCFEYIQYTDYTPNDAQVESIKEAMRWMAGGIGFRIVGLARKDKRGNWRAYYHDEAIHIAETSGRGTIFHEIAHGVEQYYRPILDACRRFVYDRAKEYAKIHRKVLRPVSLNKLCHTDIYEDDEMCLVDYFVTDYVGKLYPHCTEVFSVGMEMMAHPDTMLKLARRDPEHFFLMLGCLDEIRHQA